MQAISLFSGAGGFEIGFQRAGIETVLQAESDPWCLSVLGRHWPDMERVTDVRQVDAVAWSRRCRDVDGNDRSANSKRLGDAPRSSAGPDLVYGGFPCQDVSVAGKRSGFRGERSSLWFEFERVLRELRPRWTVIENVPGLLSSNDGRDFARVLMGLGDLGYGWAYRVLDARWFGVPQRRRRVFVVGCAGDARRAAQVLAVCESCGGHPPPGSEAWQDTPAETNAGIGSTGCRSVIAQNGSDIQISDHFGAVSASYARQTSGDLLVEDVAGTLGSHHGNVRADQAWTGQLVARGLPSRQERLAGDSDNFVVANNRHASDGHHGHSSPRGDGADSLIAFHQIQDPISTAECSPALGGKTSGMGISNDAGVRRLTPLECERLMGWPDDWTRWAADDREIPDSHRYRMCGNGVVATVAEWVGWRLTAVDAMLRDMAA